MWTMDASMATVEKEVAKKDKQQVAAIKAKKLSLKKRKACIKKKTMELSVLCDIEACVVIVDGNGEVETWPENQSAVMKILTRYKNFVQSDAGDDKNECTCDEGLLKESVFGSDQNQNMVLNLYSWDDPLIDGLPLASLQEVLGAVDNKLEAVARRIEVLNMVDDHDNKKGKEIVVFREASEQKMIQTPTTFPGSMCLGGEYLNHQTLTTCPGSMCLGGEYLNHQTPTTRPGSMCLSGGEYLNHQTPTTCPGSMCLSGGEYLNQQITEAPNFGWFNDGSSFCFNNVLGSPGIDVVMNNNQSTPSFGGHSEQGFFHTSSGQQTMQTPCFFGQGSDQVLFNMEPGMYPPPQYTTRGLFPGQTTFGIWQNPTGWS